MQQYVNETNEQRRARLEEAKTDCRKRHDQFMQFADSVCDTTHTRALVKPSGHTERHTDTYNINELALTDLLNIFIIRYRKSHMRLPETISLSRVNMMLLMLQDIRGIYRNEFGQYRLAIDERLDNNTIICS